MNFFHSFLLQIEILVLYLQPKSDFYEIQV